MRISWIFAGKWTVFFANRWGIRRGNAPDFVQGWYSLIAVDAVYKPFFQLNRNNLGKKRLFFFFFTF